MSPVIGSIYSWPIKIWAGSERALVKLSKNIAVILVGHGSKAPGFDKTMRQVVAKLKQQKNYASVCCAYLEINLPSIPEAIEVAVQNGAKEVRVLPYFLLTGRHVIHDIPKIVHEAKVRHAREAKVILCPYLGFDPKLVKLVQERIKQIAR